MATARFTGKLIRAAQALVQDQMAVAPGESVLLTADTASDQSCTDALMAAVELAGGRPLLAIVPQLPFQGKLADPYLPSGLAAALRESDVWIDVTHPFIAGSQAHDDAMKAKRLRGLGAGGLDAGALIRLYGMVDLDHLYELQVEVDALISGAAGETCRLTDEIGTDVSFTIAPNNKGAKRRRADVPGMNTIPGSAVIYPDLASVRGRVRIVAAMHEYYAALERPLTLDVDGQIRRIVEAGPDADILDRALRRAGRGGYGHVIHFSYGFHPSARFLGRFVEDIRTVGANAIGFGTPWWEPGGGENHPDGVVLRQTLAIGDTTVIKDGRIVAPEPLAKRAAALLPRLD